MPLFIPNRGIIRFADWWQILWGWSNNASQRRTNDSDRNKQAVHGDRVARIVCWGNLPKKWRYCSSSECTTSHWNCNKLANFVQFFVGNKGNFGKKMYYLLQYRQICIYINKCVGVRIGTQFCIFFEFYKIFYCALANNHQYLLKRIWKTILS